MATTSWHNTPRALALCLFEMDWYNVAALDAEGKDVTFGYVTDGGKELCGCGLPATHLTARDGSAEWACLVPVPTATEGAS